MTDFKVICSWASAAAGKFRGKIGQVERKFPASEMRLEQKTDNSTLTRSRFGFK
jgi:hypothetical protein